MESINGWTKGWPIRARFIELCIALEENLIINTCSWYLQFPSYVSYIYNLFSRILLFFIFLTYCNYIIFILFFYGIYSLFRAILILEIALWKQEFNSMLFKKNILIIINTIYFNVQFKRISCQYFFSEVKKDVVIRLLE